MIEKPLMKDMDGNAMCCNSGNSYDGCDMTAHYAHIAGLKALEPRYKAVIARIKSHGIPMPSFELGGKSYQDIYCTGKSVSELAKNIEKWEKHLNELEEKGLGKFK